jgi:hypothetical protein
MDNDDKQVQYGNYIGMLLFKKVEFCVDGWPIQTTEMKRRGFAVDVITDGVKVKTINTKAKLKKK